MHFLFFICNYMKIYINFAKLIKRTHKVKLKAKNLKDILRGGAVEARRAHNPKVVGSSPTPATNSYKTLNINTLQA